MKVGSVVVLIINVHQKYSTQLKSVNISVQNTPDWSFLLFLGVLRSIFFSAMTCSMHSSHNATNFMTCSIHSLHNATNFMTCSIHSLDNATNFALIMVPSDLISKEK